MICSVRRAARWYEAMRDSLRSVRTWRYLRGEARRAGAWRACGDYTRWLEVDLAAARRYRDAARGAERGAL